MPKNSYYLIDDSVEFHYEDNYLHSRDGLQPVNLQIPASRCLLALVKNHGEVVSQAELILAAWDERGIQITTNAFYQTILHLRRSLKLIGVDKDFIKTINRRGLVVSKKWNVILHEQNNLDISVPEIDDQTVRNIHPRWITQSLTVYLIACLIIFIGSIFIFLLPEPKPAFYNYKIISGGNIPVDCEVYTNQEGGYDKRSEIINSHPDICKNFPVIYLTEFDFIDKVSIIACDNEFQAKANIKCKSFYFPEYKG